MCFFFFYPQNAIFVKPECLEKQVDFDEFSPQPKKHFNNVETSNFDILGLEHFDFSVQDDFFKKNIFYIETFESFAVEMGI